jgi:hypothetical protein
MHTFLSSASSKRLSGILCGWLMCAIVHAAPAAHVALVQPPAWLLQDGVRRALQPGQALAEASRIVTGPEGRVLLNLGEGSAVKLGAEAMFEVTALDASAVDQIFRASLKVLTGAFRFTTSTLSAQFKREIKATVGTATIGIRGTDVWGKASPERDFVVLIEGAIEVTRGNETIAMSTPLTLLNASQAQPVDPLRAVAADELGRYAAETEPVTEAGSLVPAGVWRLVLKPFRRAHYACRCGVGRRWSVASSFAWRPCHRA